MLKEEVLSLLKQINKVKKEHSLECSLVSNCYYLKNGNILALRNPYGDSRYPYSVNGLTLWAYASGNILINQSNFFISPLTVEGKEPYINLYGAIKNKKGEYDYYSFFGNQDFNLDAGEVYTVYNENYCYYIRKIKQVVLAAKMMVTPNKKIIISSAVINKSNKEVDAFISFYFNPLLTHTSDESEETKWFRTIYQKKECSTFLSIEDISREKHLYNYLVLKNANNGERSLASRRMDYVGDKNCSIGMSKCLRKGNFDKYLPTASFVDMVVYGDIIKAKLNKNEQLQSNYQMSICFDKNDCEALEKEAYSLFTNDEYFNNVIKSKTSNLKIRFGEFKDKYKLNNVLFNNFLDSVIKQVNYGSSTKNSSLMLLGIRDVYQMMEASLLWDPKQVRAKIIESLGYIDECGRAPRQYSKETEGAQPLFDNREFIDQGQWIISTIYQYLAFTNDYSLLKEKCGYYKLNSRKTGIKLDLVESVFDHLNRLLNYLISNIDEDTNCLKSLYGDWNDAVDGLGATNKEDQQFGNGVSIMATCHLYKNLFEMYEITKQFKGIEKKEYLELAKKVEQGVIKNGIVSKDGKNRIVHGWGEDRSFYVGSFKDVDGKSRHSSASNSFFVISKIYENNRQYKDAILEAYDALDSKYGLKTFDEYFAKADAYKVGRIVNLPKGTAENAATYIHAGLFFSRALFMMNEGEKAFDQIYKLIPITHSKITTSPFVMPNSYGENPDLGIDGESMSDWYTGSSNTFLKAIVFDMFGINPKLGNVLEIKPTNYFPCRDASINLSIKKKKVLISYKDNKFSSRKILVNGNLLKDNRIDLSTYPSSIKIEIID